MKRLHVHMAVEDLQQAIDFYTVMFGAEPTRRESDYAKWQLDDPRMNFAISARGHTAGMEHLGIEFDDPAELAETQQRIAAVDGKARDQKRTTCCYAVSDKSWVADPTGAMWEVFHTVAEAERFGERATERTGKDPVTGGGDPKA